MTRLYIFSWPSYVGGADTKLDHLLELIHKEYKISCIANAPSSLEQKEWTDYLDSLGIDYGLKEDFFPYEKGAIALSLCNPYFFNQGFCEYAYAQGLKIIWSSEMMWHHDRELEFVHNGYVSKVLYVSEIQKAKLTYPDRIPSAMTGNFIWANRFPFKERNNPIFTIGRLSRADHIKYTEDFPLQYDLLNLPEVQFRAMAWSEDLSNKYRWHNFDWTKWKFYDSNQIPSLDFLYQLDLFLYTLGQDFIESWGRSTVEAMLTGAIPIVYSGHHLDNIIINGKTGYILDDYRDIKAAVHYLYNNPDKRKEMAIACRKHAEKNICNPEEHLKVWKEALTI